MQPSVVLIIWALICLSFWIANVYYPHKMILNGFFTFLALSIIYLVFRVVLQGRIRKSIKDKKTSYSFSKIVSILYVTIFLIALAYIWVENPQEVLIASGLAGAGIAIALQDVFKNLAGGALIFMNSIYRVGDRIEIASKSGDVIDIGILYTTIYETREWVQGDQATGRLASIPNGLVLNNSVINYNKDHNFIWDEISIPITYQSEWATAVELVMKIVRDETAELTEQAEKQMANLVEKYYLDKRTVEPSVYITLTDNWVAVNIRYITDVRKRRIVKDAISRAILVELQKSTKIEIASATLDIVGFPDANLRTSRDKSSERGLRSKD